MSPSTDTPPEKETLSSAQNPLLARQQQQISQTIQRYQAGTGRAPTDLELEVWRHSVEADLDRAKRLAMAAAGIKP